MRSDIRYMEAQIEYFETKLKEKIGALKNNIANLEHEIEDTTQTTGYFYADHMISRADEIKEAAVVLRMMRATLHMVKAAQEHDEKQAQG